MPSGEAFAQPPAVGGEHDPLPAQDAASRDAVPHPLQPCGALQDGTAAELVDQPQRLLVAEIGPVPIQGRTAAAHRVAVGHLAADFPG